MTVTHRLAGAIPARSIDKYGEEYWYVYEVTKGDEVTYYKLDGWYASYIGSQFDDSLDLKEVDKKPVVKIEWVRKR